MDILEEYEKRLDDVRNLNVQESIEKERHLIQMIDTMMTKKTDPEVSFLGFFRKWIVKNVLYDNMCTSKTPYIYQK